MKKSGRTIYMLVATALVALVALLGAGMANGKAVASVGGRLNFWTQANSSTTTQVHHPNAMVQPAQSDTSPPLRTIPVKHTQVQQEDNENPLLPRNVKLNGVVDNVIQRALGPLVMPAPIQNFDGEYNEYGPIPPDTNGDVGRNHYVQIVNSGFTVYSKTGTVLYGPANNNTLFTGFGGLCETTNSGDPVALYDPMADRWLLTWFAFASQAGPTHQCVAVSTGPDPLGSWYRYDFVVGNGFEDYPHMTCLARRLLHDDQLHSTMEPTQPATTPSTGPRCSRATRPPK